MMNHVPTVELFKSASVEIADSDQHVSKDVEISTSSPSDLPVSPLPDEFAPVAPSISRADDDDFRWDHNNEDIAVPEQRALAVYSNRWGQAVLRTERAWDEDDDTYIIISIENLPVIIERLQALLAGAK